MPLESKSTFTKAALNLIQVQPELPYSLYYYTVDSESIEDVDSIAATTSIIEKNADQQHRKLWVVTF